MVEVYMVKRILLIVMMLLVPVLAFAAPKYSIKTMTPEVQSALDARKERFAELRDLKASGLIGEDNQGYVKALTGDAKAQSIASEENNNRKVIYTTIAEQNGLENALSTIEAAFAAVQREKAKSGDKIQDEDGSWSTK
jgi:uncharacterized protein YdbL (DUF1318 family)